MLNVNSQWLFCNRKMVLNYLIYDLRYKNLNKKVGNRNLHKIQNSLTAKELEYLVLSLMYYNLYYKI